MSNNIISQYYFHVLPAKDDKYRLVLVDMDDDTYYPVSYSASLEEITEQIKNLITI